MEKKIGMYILELYSKYGSKKEMIEAVSFIDGTTKAKDWEDEAEGNSAVLTRVLYNTHDKRDTYV